MKKHTGFILLSAAFGLISAHAAVDCVALSLSVKSAASANRSKVVELVSREVAATPSCACEIVKAAIEGSEADAKTVAAIVQSAATVAPEQMRLVSRCAVATAPDSLAEVQAVIALLDPNLGEAGSAKDSKVPAGEVAAMPNPLDFPGSGLIPGTTNVSGSSSQTGSSSGQGLLVGPTPGGPGGSSIFFGVGNSTAIGTIPPIGVQFQGGPPPFTPGRPPFVPGPPPFVPGPPPVSPGNFPPGPPF